MPELWKASVRVVEGEPNSLAKDPPFQPLCAAMFAIPASPTPPSSRDKADNAGLSLHPLPVVVLLSTLFLSLESPLQLFPDFPHHQSE